MFTILRFLFALCGAAALLYTFSYPDSLLPPNPAAEDMEGITLYDMKPWFWLAPLLYTELVCVAGRHRNLVWFGALLIVLIGGLLAWPVLQAWRPELVHPMLEFEDGKLAAGLGYLAIVLMGSILFRFVLLPYLFQRYEPSENDGSSVDATVLDPANARTVREIAAEPIRVRPHFLFGEADQGIISRFQALVGKLILRSRRRRLLFCSALALGIMWFFLYPQPDARQSWERALAAMYETDASGMRATPRAVHAAYRVMKRIHDEEKSLAGMTREQAEKALHLDRVPAAYRKLLRNEEAPDPSSVDITYTMNRTPFLTVTDGRRRASLYISTDAEDKHINIAEAVDSGWNAIADEQRRIIGNDWKMSY